VLAGNIEGWRVKIDREVFLETSVPFHLPVGWSYVDSTAFNYGVNINVAIRSMYNVNNVNTIVSR
jgi:hypothetical protein